MKILNLEQIWETMLWFNEGFKEDKVLAESL